MMAVLSVSPGPKPRIQIIKGKQSHRLASGAGTSTKLRSPISTLTAEEGWTDGLLLMQRATINESFATEELCSGSQLTTEVHRIGHFIGHYSGESCIRAGASQNKCCIQDSIIERR